LLSNGNVLFTAGYDHSYILATSEIYKTVPSWAATGSLAVNRDLHTAILLTNGQVLACGGYNGTNALSDAALFNPDTGAWTVTNSMNVARYLHTATLLTNGQVLVAGGCDGTNPLVRAELYNPATGTWASLVSMSKARYGHTASLLIDGRVLISGGVGTSGTPTNSAEVYDPVAGTWTATGAMVAPRSGHTATRLANGNVLLAGGTNKASGLLASAEVCNPVTAAWTATGSLKDKHANHTATLLPNGKVLVAGGYDVFVPYSSPTSGVELYDPVSGTWTATNAMASLRANHAALMLPSGNVLVVGGGFTLFGQLFTLSSAELYDTAQGTWTAAPPLITARQFCAVTLLASSGVLATGGFNGNYLGSSELYGLPYALSPLTRPNGTPCFSFTNIHGFSFAIMTSTNLSFPFTNWQMIGGVTETAPGRFLFTDPRGTNGGQHFYRALSQ
jgi:N-acetylneuraminic acid mutarotase